MKITLLGCGESSGVPRIGCGCEVCASGNPRNSRLRASILIEQGDTRLLVDTTPDLRQQALRHGIKTVDAVFYTHAHADHIHGIDDVRSFNFHKGEPLPAYSDAQTLRLLTGMFPYVFNTPEPERGWFRPQLSAVEVVPGEVFKVGDIEILPFWQNHGRGKSLGLRIGDFAYSTDANGFPEASEPHLRGLKCWLVDCLSIKPVPTHAHLEMTLGWIEKYQPQRAVLTHLSHHMEYDSLSAGTPPHVEIAYDGLVIEV